MILSRSSLWWKRTMIEGRVCGFEETSDEAVEEGWSGERDLGRVGRG